MKNIIFSLLFIGCFCIYSHAQNNEPTTYKELLAQQKIERQELKDIQKEFLEKLYERHKEEMQTEDRATSGMGLLIDDHRRERDEILKRFTEEREKQMQIQADERKLFIQPKPRL